MQNDGNTDDNRMYNTFSTMRFWTTTLELSWQTSKKKWHYFFGKTEYEVETGENQFIGEMMVWWWCGGGVVWGVTVNYK